MWGSRATALETTLLWQLARCIGVSLELVATLTFPLPASPEYFRPSLALLEFTGVVLCSDSTVLPPMCVLFTSWKVEGNFCSAVPACVV